MSSSLPPPPRHDHAPTRQLPPAWRPYLASLPFYTALDARGQLRLEHDTCVLVDAKRWVGYGIEVTDEIKVSIAAQAALLTLNVAHEHYPNVKVIVVHPTSFADAEDEQALQRPSGRATLGAARADGVVVLAWDAVRRGAIDPHDGRNLVFHEFAHELDLMDGAPDGRPPLGDAAQLAQWEHVFHMHLVHLRSQIVAGHTTLLDRYGAANRAELFAVATECFFERGAELARQHPDLYLVLWRYYGQDPATR